MTKQHIIILGIDNSEQARAAKFDFAQADAVRKAASLMELHLAVPKSDAQRKLVARLADGKLFASGKGLVPRIKFELYEALTKALELEVAPRLESAAQAPDPTAKPQPLPQAWLDLKVGNTVVAPGQNPSEDGYWPGVITAIKGDYVVLRWIDAPKLKPASFSRNQIAILPTSNTK
jgi:hypothetical protein